MQKRFQNDMSINNTTVDILQDQQWVSIPWRKLQVGDIVKVSPLLFLYEYMNCCLFIAVCVYWVVGTQV